MAGSTYDDFNENPRKSGTSNATKIVLILACVFGVACLACCGGVMYMGKQVADKISNDPVKIREVAGGILDFQPPGGLAPQMSMDMTMMGVGTRMVSFTDPANESSLTIMELAVPKDQAPPAMPNNAGGADLNGQAALPFKDSVVQKMKINGQDATFEIGTTSGSVEQVQTSGTFITKAGHAGTLLLLTKPSVMDQDAVIAFVRSLGTPVGEPEARAKPAATETPESTDSTEKPADATDKPADTEKPTDAADKPNDSDK